MNAALLLLLMAEQLTVGKSGFAMYWTDWSLFNIAVDQQHRLKIVDAENIILVDLQKILRGIIFQRAYREFYFIVFSIS